MKQTGCKHYQRSAKLVAPCCDKVYTCRLCHDEHEDHELDRTKVEEIVCAVCETKQAPDSQNCVNPECRIILGKYFCATCRLYDDTPKQQWHCEQCGICRAGGEHNFFHCDVCDLCLPVRRKDSHKCIESVGRTDCTVCLEDLHSSRTGQQVLRCGHLLHPACYQGLREHRIATCPECAASLFNRDLEWERLDWEVKRNKVPHELRHRFVQTYCRDCQAKTEAPYHMVGLKCGKCGSYNTAQDGDLVHRVPDTGVYAVRNLFRGSTEGRERRSSISAFFKSAIPALLSAR